MSGIELALGRFFGHRILGLVLFKLLLLMLDWLLRCYVHICESRVGLACDRVHSSLRRWVLSLRLLLALILPRAFGFLPKSFLLLNLRGHKSLLIQIASR